MLLRNIFIKLFVSGFGLGYIPLAPGTFGSLLGVPLAFTIGLVDLPYRILFFILFVGVAIYLSGEAEIIYGVRDSGKIVVDEIAGYILPFVFLDFTVKSAVIIFFLFRFFDIVKLPPAKYFQEKLKAGASIVLDDVAAGFHSLIIYWILLKLFIIFII